MATTNAWAPFVFIRTDPGSNVTDQEIGFVIAHELIETVTDPSPPGNDEGFDPQYAWTAGTNADAGYANEICEYCEAFVGEFNDGLQVPYYFDKITRKCVSPATGESNQNPDVDATYSNNGGPILADSEVWLIFWGTTWSTTNATLRTNVINRIQNQLLNTDKAWFNTARTDYGNFNYPKWGGYITHTADVPVDINAFDTYDIFNGLTGAITTGSGGLPDPLSDSFVSKAVTVSNRIYVLIPDLSWDYTANDPVVTFAFAAYHWMCQFAYTTPDPPAPPPPPPNAPPPTPPTPPPPGTDASTNGFNTVDGYLSTAWSDTATPWITFDVGFDLEMSSIKIDFLDGEKKVYFFDISWSVDNSTWNTITPPSGTATWRSDGTTTSFQTFTFPVVTAQYLRLTGHGNNGGSGSTARNDVFAISEVQIWGPDVDMTIPPTQGGTGGGPPTGTGEGAWVWSGTEWVWTTTIPGSGGGGGTGGTGTDPGTGPNIPAAPPPIVTIYKDFIDTYNLAVETGDLCASGNVAAEIPLAKIYESPVTNMLVYLKMARAGGDVQRVGEAAVSDNSALIGKAPRKVSVTLKRVGTCDGVVYCRIRDSKNKIKQELGTMPAASVTLNDTTCDFENDLAQYIMKKGDVIWIEYDDPSASDGATYLLYKAGDKDNFDAINSMFVKYTSTTIPDPLSDLAAVISV